MTDNQPRRKGFSFLSFLLGFIIGIIFIIGSVVGVVIYALSAKVDNVLGMVGLDNSKDESGKNQYINSDRDNGGVETLLELMQRVASMASDTGNLSLGDVENLLPAVSGLVDGLHGTLAVYVDVQREEFTAVKFSQLGSFMQEKVLDIQPAVLFDTMGMGGMLDNKIIELMLCGKEADYVVNGEETYPVYYDIYVENGGDYFREGDNAPLPEEYKENLVLRGNSYRLYYYFVNDTAYITDGDFTFTPPARSANGAVYSLYSAEYARLSGNYYYVGGEKVDVDPVTLRTLSNGGFDALDDVYLAELLENDDALAEKVLGGVSLGDVMNGTVDFEGVIEGLLLSDLMDVSATDKIMTRLIYGVCDVKAAEGETYAYVGTYVGGDKEIPCYIEVEEGGENNVISRIYYIDDGKEVEISSLSVGDMQDGLDIGGLKIGEIMDVKGNMILENLADATIDGLPEAINNLTINEIYYEEIYRQPAYLKDDDGNFRLDENGERIEDEDSSVEATLKKAVLENPEEGEIEFSTDYLYYAKDENGKLHLVNLGGESELGKLTAAQFKENVADGAEYYTYGEAQGIWKILLYKKTTGNSATEDSTTDNSATENSTTEGAYSINKLTDMVANVSNNISSTSLYDLHDNGILVFENRKDLDLLTDNDGTTLGELQLTEALTYLTTLLKNT